MSEATGKKAVLQLDGKEIELPIYSGTLGPDVIDVKDLGNIDNASFNFLQDIVRGYIRRRSSRSDISRNNW